MVLPMVVFYHVSGRVLLVALCFGGLAGVGVLMPLWCVTHSFDKTYNSTYN